jgi:hypothetical protein
VANDSAAKLAGNDGIGRVAVENRRISGVTAAGAGIFGTVSVTKVIGKR